MQTDSALAPVAHDDDATVRAAMATVRPAPEHIAAFTSWLREQFNARVTTGRLLHTRYCEWCELEGLMPANEETLFAMLASLRGWSRYFNDPVIRALLDAGKYLDNRHLAAATKVPVQCPRTGKVTFKRLSEGEVSKRRAVDLKPWVYTAGRSGPANKSVMIWVRPLKTDEVYPASQTLWTWPKSDVVTRTIADVCERRMAA